jgi:hypothetical protein
MTAAAERPMTSAEAAALELEPWEHDGECALPTAKEWAGILITLRLGWRTMFRSKAQLIEAMAEDEDTFIELIDLIGDVSNTLKGLSALVSSAEVRLLASGAAHALAEQRDDA